MKSAIFNGLLDRRMSELRVQLVNAGVKYGTEEDRFHNFNREAEIQRISREKSLVGNMSKELVGVLDMVDNFGKVIPSEAEVDEKGGNVIKYMLLLEAMMKEDIYEAMDELTNIDSAAGVTGNTGTGENGSTGKTGANFSNYENELIKNYENELIEKMKRVSPKKRLMKVPYGHVATLKRSRKKRV